MGLNEKTHRGPWRRAALTRPASSLWSPAMRKDAPQDNYPPAGERPDEALKKAPGPSKASAAKEARLAAALRENLRRRKAALKKETD